VMRPAPLAQLLFLAVLETTGAAQEAPAVPTGFCPACRHQLPQLHLKHLDRTLALSRPKVPCLPTAMPSSREPVPCPALRRNISETVTGSSARRQDNKVAHVFSWSEPWAQQRMCAGSFVEMGAWDGKFGTNTAMFERLGWRGLCVEPSPTAFAELVRNRPECINVNALISNQTGIEQYLQMSVQGWSGMEKFMSQKLLKELKAQKITIQKRMGVKTMPLGHLLARHEMQHVDLFSLDVEGAEMEVLSAIDFGRVTFGAFLIENGASPEIIEFLESKGYNMLGGVDKIDILWGNACLYPSL